MRVDITMTKKVNLTKEEIHLAICRWLAYKYSDTVWEDYRGAVKITADGNKVDFPSLAEASMECSYGYLERNYVDDEWNENQPIVGPYSQTYLDSKPKDDKKDQSPVDDGLLKSIGEIQERLALAEDAADAVIDTNERLADILKKYNIEPTKGNGV